MEKTFQHEGKTYLAQFEKGSIAERELTYRKNSVNLASLLRETNSNDKTSRFVLESFVAEYPFTEQDRKKLIVLWQKMHNKKVVEVYTGDITNACAENEPYNPIIDSTLLKLGVKITELPKDHSPTESNQIAMTEQTDFLPLSHLLISTLASQYDPIQALRIANESLNPEKIKAIKNRPTLFKETNPSYTQDTPNYTSRTLIGREGGGAMPTAYRPSTPLTHNRPGNQLAARRALYGK